MTYRYGLALLVLGVCACSDSSNDANTNNSTTGANNATTGSNNATTGSNNATSASNNATSNTNNTASNGSMGPIDIKDVIFTQTDPDCGSYDNTLEAAVLDITRDLGFDMSVVITATDTACSLVSNNIPNHDFNDATAHFATATSEQALTFSIPRHPSKAATATALSQRTYDAVFLNGVPLDLLSAGCYSPNSPMADADGNVAIGCNVTSAWLLDPLGASGRFGADAHNAHTQPNGSYHYHGNPMAMFDDDPGENGSPVIGFAADGFPIYGTYFNDGSTVRKATSSYVLIAGTRPSTATDPGGTYDGTYIDDYEYQAGSGDLDACNGMTVNGQYAYYVTDAYPWVLNCHSGTPDPSFNKGR